MSKEDKPKNKKVPKAPVDEPKVKSVPVQRPVNMSDVLRFLDEEKNVFVNEFKLEKQNAMNHYAMCAPGGTDFQPGRLNNIGSLVNAITVLMERAQNRAPRRAVTEVGPRK